MATRQPQVGKRLTVALSKAFSRLTFGSRPWNLESLAAHVRACGPGSCLRVSSALLDCDRDKVLREALCRRLLHRLQVASLAHLN